MTIKELNILGMGLRALGDLPMVGSMKFKIARNIKAVEDILEDALSASEDVDNDADLLNTDVDVNLMKFTEEELEPLEIDSKTIFMLLPIVAEEGGSEDE